MAKIRNSVKSNKSQSKLKKNQPNIILSTSTDNFDPSKNQKKHNKNKNSQKNYTSMVNHSCDRVVVGGGLMSSSDKENPQKHQES